jgi:hypothetical protein
MPGAGPADRPDRWSSSPRQEPPGCLLDRRPPGHLVGVASVPQGDRRNALDEIRDELIAAWGDPNEEREVARDLHMRVGRIAG